MSNPKPDKPATTDQILDLLLDALLERNAARRAQSFAQVPPPSPPPEPPRAAEVPPARVSEPEAQRPPAAPAVAAARPPAARPPVARPPAAPAAPVIKPGPGEPGWELPPREPSINLGKTLGRLAILVAVLVVLVNIPVNRYGDGLARAMPDSASIVIRDGTVLKGSGPEIYRLENDKLRWISSLDAFEHLGLTWADVHIVDDGFLADFEKGAPIHVLVKCEGSPHIYRLENSQKRWIKDIDTFTAEGHVWEDVRFVSCQYLRDLPDGPPIPEDAGPPPQPQD